MLPYAQTRTTLRCALGLAAPRYLPIVLGAVTVGSVSSWPLLELAKLEVEDYWKVQLSALGFFWLYAIEAFLFKRRLFAKPTPAQVTDLCYWLFMPPLRVVARILSVSLVVLLGLLLGGHHGVHPLDGFGPLARQPTALIIVELVVLMDFATYWAHRSFHAVPFLWRFHSLHHSATYVRWSTTGRVHPLNELANYIVTIVPFAVVGFPVNAVLPVMPIVIAYALFAHTQVNVSFGPLSSLFVSPRFHRWHHTHSNEGGNKNFANVFSFWDRVFGTYYLPQDRLPEHFGLDTDEVPENYWRQLLYPWRKAAGRAGATDRAEPRQMSAAPIGSDLDHDSKIVTTNFE